MRSVREFQVIIRELVGSDLRSVRLALGECFVTSIECQVSTRRMFGNHY